MKIVVFTEEESSKEVLNILLPQIIPSEFSYKVVAFNGSGALEKGILKKLRGWNEPDVRFVILEDQDNADCVERKQRLVGFAEEAGKPVLVRIACRELEAWYFGDLKAVADAYDMPEIARYGKKRKYRDVDAIHDVKEEFYKIVPGHQQIMGARKIAPHMDINRNVSPSFHAFVSGIRRLVSECGGNRSGVSEQRVL